MKLRDFTVPSILGMTLDGVKVFTLENFTDERGCLLEFYRGDHVAVKNQHFPMMGYLSITLPGTKRGPHEHEYQTDYFAFISAKFDLHLWDNRGERHNLPAEDRHCVVPSLGEENPTVVIVPPGVVHGYINVSDRPGMVINLPDELYKGYSYRSKVDEIRHENDPSSPFIIPAHGEF